MTDPAQSRRRWRRAFFALLVLWLVTAASAAYAVIDQGVTLTYHEASARDMARDFRVLLRAAPALGGSVTRSAVLTTLRRQHPDALISATDSTVRRGDLTFRFAADGRLQAVDHEYVSAWADSL